jgi:two-component system, OmpR family, sensor kinase
MRTDGTPRTEQGRLLATLERLLTIKALEVKSALDEASTLVAEAVGADKVDAFMHDPATETLVAVGTSDTPLGHKQRRLGLDRLPLVNGGRLVRVFQSGASFRTGHTEDDPEELLGIKQGLGVRSTLAAVIEIDGERRGVLAMTSAQPERFSFEDLRFTEAVARWVGLVAHRAALVERVTREAAEQARRVAADELIEMLAHDLRTP